MDDELRKAIVRLGYDAILLRLALEQADLIGCTTEDAVSAAFVLNEAAAAICKAITKITNAAVKPMAQTPPELLAELQPFKIRISDAVLEELTESNVVRLVQKPKVGNP